MKRVTLVLAVAGATVLAAASAQAQTLKTIKDRGMISCGVSQGLPGFSSPDDKGNWTGMDVDVCRAVAAAVFNDPSKVKFVPLSAKDRFTALQSGEIDVLSRNTTWTLSRDTSLGANFTGVTYYDGQGFLVKKSLKVNSALELNSASVCVQTGTTTEQNLADYFKANPGRIPLMHAKDFLPGNAKDYPGAELGRGTLDYKPIMAAADAAGLKHCFVEQEGPFARMSSLDAARVDFDYLRPLR